MTEPRSPLARFAHLHRQPDADEAWKLARDAWHTHGLVLVNPETHGDRIGWVTCRMVRNIGEELYGKRKAVTKMSQHSQPITREGAGK